MPTTDLESIARTVLGLEPKPLPPLYPRDYLAQFLATSDPHAARSAAVGLIEALAAHASEAASDYASDSLDPEIVAEWRLLAEHLDDAQKALDR